MIISNMNQYYKCNQGYLLELKPNDIFTPIFFLILIVIVFLLTSCFYKVTIYKDFNLLVVKEKGINYYIYSPIRDTKTIKESKKIVIDKTTYTYSVSKVGDVKYDEYNKTNYQLVTIKLNLAKKYHINNLQLKVSVKVKEEKLIKYLFNMIFERE